jgi:hypothetical protein
MTLAAEWQRVQPGVRQPDLDPERPKGVPRITGLAELGS